MKEEFKGPPSPYSSPQRGEGRMRGKIHPCPHFGKRDCLPSAPPF